MHKIACVSCIVPVLNAPKGTHGVAGCCKMASIHRRTFVILDVGVNRSIIKHLM